VIVRFSLRDSQLVVCLRELGLKVFSNKENDLDVSICPAVGCGLIFVPESDVAMYNMNEAALLQQATSTVSKYKNRAALVVYTPLHQKNFCELQHIMSNFRVPVIAVE
jgi:hypothetical protein